MENIWKQMIVVIDRITFEKVIGESNIYCEQYGVYIPDSGFANTFEELIEVSSKWLEAQD